MPVITLKEPLMINFKFIVHVFHKNFYVHVLPFKWNAVFDNVLSYSLEMCFINLNLFILQNQIIETVFWVKILLVNLGFDW